MQFPSEKDKKIQLPGAVGAIEALTSVPKAPCADVTVVICHPHPLYQGTMNNKVIFTLARAFEALGLRTVRFNYRGVGESEGSYGEGVGEADDALAVMRWVQSARPDDAIWLAGFSFGGYVAARAASLSSVGQLLTVAPSVEHFDFGTLATIAAPWLVIQGEKDDVVSPSAVYQWAEAAEEAPTLIRVPEVGHFFHGHLPELKHAVITHYQTRLSA
jgi:uncharacterized protein